MGIKLLHAHTHIYLIYRIKNFMPQFSIVFPKTHYLYLKKEKLKIGCLYVEIFYFEKKKKKYCLGPLCVAVVTTVVLTTCQDINTAVRDQKASPLKGGCEEHFSPSNNTPYAGYTRM